ncbi:MULTISPECIES: glutathione S-transferase family protein [Tepidimonas]|uniref:Glutathione S-transferase n=2 Tax=Tepidimonas TaxID=114248 RepID=A0A4R3L4Y2_9BURK|nr:MULTISPECIES: glutathione S-transferase family protein [Tepidimonas]MCX7813968.1 glutathione S-transferase family protein [Tepidimonas ignava]TCS94015.1 glutathione S-transferase [Tepidimonas ignava]TSE18755.1 Glutathione S-transferase GST-4.5 [Tepidimonas ignava]TSE27036.1 Glutathione S-transferase GST-4.5 [Tepidimonas aquatica]
MPLQLYYAPGACSFVPHAALELAGASFEPVLVKLHKGEHHSPAFRAINPRGQVPVLVDDGQAITQIVAIGLHLDARFPQAQLLPPQGLARTRALELLAWMNNTVHPTFTHVFMPAKFTDDAAAQASVKAHALTRYRALLEELEAMVTTRSGPWLGGASPGLLDAYALTLLRWGGFAGIDPTTLPHTWALAQSFAALPPVARVVERERLQLNVYQPAAA